MCVHLLHYTALLVFLKFFGLTRLGNIENMIIFQFNLKNSGSIVFVHVESL